MDELPNPLFKKAKPDLLLTPFALKLRCLWQVYSVPGENSFAQPSASVSAGHLYFRSMPREVEIKSKLSGVSNFPNWRPWQT